MKPEPLTGESVERALRGLTAWSGDTSRLARTVQVRSGEIPALLDSVQHMADEMDHHPVVTRDGDRVTFTVWTHSVGAVTAKDVALAAAIDAVLAAHSAGAS